VTGPVQSSWIAPRRVSAVKSKKSKICAIAGRRAQHGSQADGSGDALADDHAAALSRDDERFVAEGSDRLLHDHPGDGTNDAQKTMGVISLALIANGDLTGAT
jgi:hypothetical protein